MNRAIAAYLRSIRLPSGSRVVQVSPRSFLKSPKFHTSFLLHSQIP